MISSELASHSSDVSPQRGDAVPAQDHTDGLRVIVPHGGSVEPELEAWPSPWNPDDAVSEDVLGELLAVSGRGDGDAGVGVEVIDVDGVDEPVRSGIDRWGRAAAAEQAVVEGVDHLVLAVETWIDVDERLQAIEAQHRQPRLGQRAEITARALHPQQRHRLLGDRVDGRALRRCVAAGIVRVARV